MGDLTERILFNGAEGARKKDERAIAYNTSPNQFMASMTSELFANGQEFGVYAPNFHVACCPAQSTRICPEYVRGMCLTNLAGDLVFPVYGPCHINKKDAQTGLWSIEEETNYPFEETIRVKIATEKPGQKLLRFRLPDWCENYSVLINGKKWTGSPKDHWIDLNRVWHNDLVELTFTMQPKIVPIKDVYFQKEPLRTIQCGPLLFALKYKEKWTPVQGNPLTPLPKDWNWFNVTCDGIPGFFALDLKALDQGKNIKKVQKKTEGYPWEDPPLILEVPMVRAQKYAWPRHFGTHQHTLLPYGNPVTSDPNAAPAPIQLVPFGCTVLRLTAFPVAK